MILFFVPTIRTCEMCLNLDYDTRITPIRTIMIQNQVIYQTSLECIVIYYVICFTVISKRVYMTYRMSRRLSPGYR